MSYWPEFVVFAAAIGVGLFLISAGRFVWRRFHPQPARWTVTVTDADGMLVKSATASAAGVAKLVTDLNTGRFA